MEEYRHRFENSTCSPIGGFCTVSYRTDKCNYLRTRYTYKSDVIPNEYRLIYPTIEETQCTIDKLGKYEDTGLTPVEVGQMKAKLQEY